MTIDKGIPIPPPAKRARIKRQTVYPIREMEIGDSFFSTEPHRIRCVLRYYRDLNGVDFTTRLRSENGREGIRIWRIK